MPPSAFRESDFAPFLSAGRRGRRPLQIKPHKSIKIHVYLHRTQVNQHIFPHFYIIDLCTDEIKIVLNNLKTENFYFFLP